jgi:small subunit ribosomal protein S17
MAKTLNGKVTSTSMQNTITVEVSFKVPHKLYKKLLTRSKKYKVDLNGKEVQVGDVVEIVETKPFSKDKYFKIEKILTSVKEAKHA